MIDLSLYSYHSTIFDIIIVIMLVILDFVGVGGM